MLLTRRISSQSPQKRGFPNLNPMKCKEISSGVKWELRQEWDPHRLATVARSNRAGDWVIHLIGSLQRQRHLQTVVAVLTTHQGRRGGKVPAGLKMKGLIGSSTNGKWVQKCCFVWYLSNFPANTHSPEEFDPPFLFMPPWDLESIKDAVIVMIKCRCLIEQRALMMLSMDSSVSTVAAAHSAVSKTRWAELIHCFILSYHRNYKCNRMLQENILRIFTLCVHLHL